MPESPPVWSINHGPTTSLYYEDPEGIRLEFQTENFPPSAQLTADYFNSKEFADNPPIGVNVDPDYLLERLRAGTSETDLLKPGAAPAQEPSRAPTSKPSRGRRCDPWPLNRS